VTKRFCFTADCTVDLVWGHTTQSMCIGYMAEQDKKPKVKNETSFILPAFCSSKTKMKEFMGLTDIN